MSTESTTDIPTGDEIRSALISRAEAFAASKQISLSTIGLKAVNDAKFFSQVKGGRGFNINTYQRVLDWLETAEKREALQ